MLNFDPKNNQMHRRGLTTYIVALHAKGDGLEFAAAIANFVLACLDILDAATLADSKAKTLAVHELCRACARLTTP